MAKKGRAVQDFNDVKKCMECEISTWPDMPNVNIQHSSVVLYNTHSHMFCQCILKRKICRNLLATFQLPSSISHTAQFCLLAMFCLWSLNIFSVYDSSMRSLSLDGNIFFLEFITIINKAKFINKHTQLHICIYIYICTQITDEHLIKN